MYYVYTSDNNNNDKNINNNKSSSSSSTTRTPCAPVAQCAAHDSAPLPLGSPTPLLQHAPPADTATLPT